METVGLEFTFLQWSSRSGLHFCALQSCTWLWAHSCMNSPWSSKCHSLAGITLPATERASPQQAGGTDSLFLGSWCWSAKHTTGAGQERAGCSGGRGCCHEKLFCKLFCRLCSTPVYKLCWREGLMYRDVRLCQSRAVFLHSSILCRIWEESLYYSVTCITACKSVYNQGLGFYPYLWMTRAESGRNSSADTVCELHNCCGYMTLLLHARPRDGRDIWQR